jgi:hypothetical protein
MTTTAEAELRAGILLAIGVVLWLVNQRFGGGRREMDTGR